LQKTILFVSPLLQPRSEKVLGNKYVNILQVSARTPFDILAAK